MFQYSKAAAWCYTVLAVVVSIAAPVLSWAQPIDPEQAMHVGGDLTRAGEKLAQLQASAAAVIAAAPATGGELTAALQRIARAADRRSVELQFVLIAISLALLVTLVIALRRAAAGLRRACLADAQRARGAGGLLALDALDRLAVAALAYLLVEVWFSSGSIQDLLAVAVLWSVVRWWLAMWLVEALLRPRHPAFRLVPMGDACARQFTRIAGVVLYAGIASISLMPLLLRVQMPIPSAQVVALVQGGVVVAGGVIGLWLYYRQELAPVRAAGRTSPGYARYAWFALAIIMVPVVWMAWSVGVLTLDFSVYHALVWSLRIAAFALIVDAVLGLSVNALAESSAPGGLWMPFAQRLIRVGAMLAIAIVLADLWLVDQFALLERAAWNPVRASLITTAVTLIACYALWRYLNHWTQARLGDAVAGLGPMADEGDVTPASRLTTVLPMLRVVLGIAILGMAALVLLSELGVNIGPLLAGAGIFGLAISFGSQALVRDIVSGIFFLSDDAFRLGEYIDTGRLKGTVERISLRSVRLRHQNGQIHTIPFGQLTAITNYSRDWQTVKFNLRLARDVDLDLARKCIKRIGEDMMKDEELGKDLLQPLKMQGVAEITDNAIVVRLKFTVRPTNPGFVQREALKRIYREFGEKGIAIASGTITVQAADPAALTPAQRAGGAVAASAASSSPAA